MKYAHTSIHTDKVEESVAFYRDVVGLTNILELPGDRVKFLSDKAGDTRIEIVRSAEPVFKAEGISVGFCCDDPASYREELISKGYKVSDLVSPIPDVAFFYVKDPNGLDVQFVKSPRNP